MHTRCSGKRTETDQMDGWMDGQSWIVIRWLSKQESCAPFAAGFDVKSFRCIRVENFASWLGWIGNGKEKLFVCLFVFSMTDNSQLFSCPVCSIQIAQFGFPFFCNPGVGGEHEWCWNSFREFLFDILCGLLDRTSWPTCFFGIISCRQFRAFALNWNQRNSIIFAGGVDCYHTFTPRRERHWFTTIFALSPFGIWTESSGFW